MDLREGVSRRPIGKPLCRRPERCVSDQCKRAWHTAQTGEPSWCDPNRKKSGGIVVGEAGTPPTLPANWQVIDGHLIGPYAQLHEAVLTNADQTGVYLSFVNQTGATSTGVTGAAKYNTATMLPAGFDPVAAGWTLVS